MRLFDIWQEMQKTWRQFVTCSCFAAWLWLKWNARPRQSVATPHTWKHTDFIESLQLQCETMAVSTVFIPKLVNTPVLNLTGSLFLHLIGRHVSEWQVNTQWGRTKCFMSIQSEHDGHGDCWCAATSKSLQRAAIHQLGHDTTRKPQP